MARISLLLSLALVLVIGSVSAHPPPSPKLTSCPPTLSELQFFPYVEISKLLEKKAQYAPANTHFQTLFAVCKTYNDHLGAFKHASVDSVVSSVHAKSALITNVFLKAQVFVGVEGEFAVKLRKSYSAMAKGFVQVVEKVGSISAKYKFAGDAKISENDKAEIEAYVIKLEASIRVYLEVITECSKKFSAEKKIGFQIGSGGFFGTFFNKGLGFGSKFIGLSGQGQVGAGANAGAKAGALGEAKLGGHAETGAKAGTKVEDHAKSGAKAGAKVGAHAEAGAKVGAHAGAGAKVGSHAGAGAKAGAKVGDHAVAGAKVGAKAGANVGAHAEAGAKVGAKAGAKVGAHAGATAGATVGGKIGGKVGGQAGAKVGAYAGAKVGAKAGAKVGAKAGAKVGAKAGAKVGAQGEGKVGVHAGSKVGGLFKGFLGFGGRAQFDAAGKANVGGGSGFRPLSNLHKKHFE